MNDWKNIYGPAPESFEERIQGTLAGLKEPRQTASRPHRTARRVSRTLLAAAVAASLLTVTALAAGLDRLGFFDTLFGTGAVAADRTAVTPTPAPPEPEVAPDGTVTQEAYEYTWSDGEKTFTSVMPGYERTPVDQALADRLIGPYIQELDQTYTLPNEGPAGTEYEGRPNHWGAAAVTFLSFVQDEAGTGYLYFRVENPDGLDLRTRESRGYTVAGEHSVIFKGGTVLMNAGGRYFLVDTENTTDTVAYIGVPIASIEEGFDYMTVLDAYGEVGGFNEEYTLHADRLVPARTGEGQYVTVAVSPMGASLRAAEGQDLGVLVDGVESFSVTMADGSEYLVWRDDVPGADPVDNTTYLCGGPDGVMGFCFNRIIDPDQIASVTVTVMTGWDGNNEPVYDTETIIF